MIHFVFALALLSPSVKNYTGDTLDFWYVYYNKEEYPELYINYQDPADTKLDDPYIFNESEEGK